MNDPPATPHSRAVFIQGIFREFFDARLEFNVVFERCALKGWPDRKAAIRTSFRLQELFYARETLRLHHLVSRSASHEAAWQSYGGLNAVLERLQEGWTAADEVALLKRNAKYSAMQTEIQDLQAVLDSPGLERPFEMVKRDPELITAAHELQRKSRGLNERLALTAVAGADLGPS